ncbi:MAG TPA: protoporphyrinogen oxidase [Terriglobales bacterium]|nr:protoporphyrinogen oxidase [Terriglobales bacterium]
MKRIAIIGGGISGLSAAFALEQQRRVKQHLEYVVFESGPRFGGVVATEQVDGCVVEAGPDSFLTEKPWASELCHQLGLGDQLIGSNDAARKTYILVNGRLVMLPDGLMFMVPTKIRSALTSPLFSTRTKFKIAREWLHPPHKAEGDESVASLIERHYGSEMVERLADPLLSGVYGGEASRLSVRAVLPRFAQMEETHGSLGRGMLAARNHSTSSAALGKPIFTSLKSGMQQMVDALLVYLPGTSLRSGTQIIAVEPQAGGWLLSAGYDSDQFDAVIIATTASAAATLLRTTDANLARELGGIEYSSSITVSLGYDQQVRSSLPAGFGFLVPRSEGKRLMAATFVHNKFPHRASDNRALIRCFLGGTRDESVLQLSHEEILRIVREELHQILGITAEPLFTRVYKWKSAMAQYNVGHLERLDRIESLGKQYSGLALAGNGYRGIGVPDCVRSGKEAAGQALAAVGLAKETAS